MLSECVLVLSLAAVVSGNTYRSCLGCGCAINKMFSCSWDQCPPCCPTVKEYDPVCGFNPCDLTFKTFDFPCLLEGTICNAIGDLYYEVYEGECLLDVTYRSSEPGPFDCTGVCEEIVDPVCGFNPCEETFITFPNLCMLNNYNCRNLGQFYFEIAKGACCNLP